MRLPNSSTNLSRAWEASNSISTWQVSDGKTGCLTQTSRTARRRPMSGDLRAWWGRRSDTWLSTGEDTSQSSLPLQAPKDWDRHRHIQRRRLSKPLTSSRSSSWRTAGNSPSTLPTYARDLRIPNYSVATITIR